MARPRSILAAATVITVVAALGVAAPQPAAASSRAGAVSASQSAAKQPVVQGFYDGKTIRYFNYGAIQLRERLRVDDALDLVVLEVDARVVVARVARLHLT